MEKSRLRRSLTLFALARPLLPVAIAFSLLASFAAASSPPNVTLVSPAANGAVSEGRVAFDCLGFDDEGVKSLALLGNWSGKMQVEETRFNPANASAQRFEVTLPRGVFEWDCLAVDTAELSAFANKSFVVAVVRRVFSATPAPQVFNRITLDCPKAAFNSTVRITVSNYKQNALSCTGFGITASYANGSDLPAGALADRGCQGDRPRYDLAFPGPGDYAVHAQGALPQVTADCTIAYRGISGRQAMRVPDFNPILAPLLALAAVLLVRRLEN